MKKIIIFAIICLLASVVFAAKDITLSSEKSNILKAKGLTAISITVLKDCSNFTVCSEILNGTKIIGKITVPKKKIQYINQSYQVKDKTGKKKTIYRMRRTYVSNTATELNKLKLDRAEKLIDKFATDLIFMDKVKQSYDTADQVNIK